MKRRLLCLVLCLVMALSLFPAMALAADANPTPDPVHEGNLYLGKTYNPQTETLTLEAYSEAEKIVHDKSVPCDIVLVLDVSGSMEYTMSEDTWTEVTQGFSYNTIEGYSTNEYYYELDGVKYQVHGVEAHLGFGWLSTHYTWLYFEKGNTRYYLTGTGYVQARSRTNPYYAGLILVPPRKTGGLVGDEISGARGESATIYTGTLWKHSTQTTRIVAMKNAVKTFIDKVHEDADTNDVDHRISIVKFASDKRTQIGNDRDRNGYNYSQIMKQLTAVGGDNNSSAEDLKSLVDAITPGGATHADYGMQLAQTVMSGAAAGSNKVVVMFTDGEPGETGFSTTVANNTVTASKALKDAGVKVYTVGVFDSNVDSRTKPYMNAVSSNYPKATSYDVKDSSVHGYFMMASNPDELTEIFNKISESEISGGVSLDASTIIRDVMKSGAFELTAADPSRIKVYTAPCTGMNGNERLFGAKTPVTAADKIKVSVNEETQTVDVTGFSFEDNWCGYDQSTQRYHGKKIIIEIPAEPAAGANGVVDTNESNSGIYDADEKLVELFPVPSFEIPTASYVIDFNAAMTVATDTTKMKGDTDVNGAFKKTGTNVTYQLTPVTLSGGATLNGKYTAVDSAMIYGVPVNTTGSAAWTNITAVPASSIYFDDDLTGKTFTANTDSGYNAALEDGANYAENEQRWDNDEATQTYCFTFTGTGADVYATTEADGAYVQAALYRGTENFSTSNRVGDAVTMKQYAADTRYNVPTLHFVGDKYDTYTIRIKALKSANFRLDGIRVYNPVDDQTLYTDNGLAQEANASFFNLRELLINDQTDFRFYDGTEPEIDVDDLDTLMPNISDKILFVDDAENVPVLGKDESGSLVPLYTTTFEAYKANSPKNEIYLADRQGIAFTISNYSALMNASNNKMQLQVGLSVANNTEETRAYFDNTNTNYADVKSPVDMYYTITPAAVENGAATFIIKNSGSAVLSVTDLKVSGTSEKLTASPASDAQVMSVGEDAATEDVTTLRLVLNTRTLKALAAVAAPDEPTAPVEAEQPATPQKPGWTNAASDPSVILKMIFKLLLQNLGNLFGGLGSW